jgi:hypothetical protein
MNALTKFSIALLLITVTAIAAYLFLAPSDEGFDAAGSQPRGATSSQHQDGICEQDEERLARLRANPSLDEGLSFVSEIRCLRLWPQLQAIMDGLANPLRPTAASRPSGPDTIPASDIASASGATSAALDDACKHDEDRLVELRANPSVEAAVRFDSELKCPTLQPQLPAILKQLSNTGSLEATNQKAPTPDTTATSAAAPPASLPPASEATSATSDDACKRDEERLAELQAKPSLGEAMRFEDELKCSSLQLQVLALLDSLSLAPRSAAAPTPNGVPTSATSAGEATPPASPPASETPSPDGAPPSTTSTGETAPPGLEPPATEATSAVSNDACKQDEERPARLRTNPSSEEATRFAQELRCETLRPELLALTGELAKPPPTQTGSVSNDVPGPTNAVKDAQPLSLAIADAERRIAALENDKEALAAEVSWLQRNQVPRSAEQPVPPPSAQPAPPAERSEPQSASQAADDAERRIAALESEKEALAAEVSKLQHDREAPSAEQAAPTPSPPASPAERSEAQAASQAAAGAERRIAELESEKVALTAEVSKLQRDREASSAEQAKPIPPPPPAAPAERSDAEPAAALASLPEGMLARVLIRYLKSNEDARAQAEKLASALAALGVEVPDVRESRSANRTELSFSYAPDETIARQVGRVVGVAPVRRLQSKDSLMVRPGTLELNLSGDSHLGVIKTTSTRERNHE